MDENKLDFRVAIDVARIADNLEKIVQILSDMSKKPNPGPTKDLAKPLIPLQQIQRALRPFIDAKCTDGLSQAIKDCGVSAPAELPDRNAQDLFLFKLGGLAANLPLAQMQTVQTVLKELSNGH